MSRYAERDFEKLEAARRQLLSLQEGRSKDEVSVLKQLADTEAAYRTLHAELCQAERTIRTQEQSERSIMEEFIQQRTEHAECLVCISVA